MAALPARKLEAFPMLNPGQVMTLSGVEWEYYEYLREVAPINWKITYAYGALQRSH